MNPLNWLAQWFVRKSPSDTGSDSIPTSDSIAAVDGLHRFAWNLYARLCMGQGNLFFSPFSLHGCLSMTMAGAAGKTEEEFAAVLHAPSDTKNYHAAIAALGRRYAGAKQYEVAYANRIFAGQGSTFHSAFEQLCAREYLAPVETVKFPEPGRSRINAWVAGQTRNHIPELIPTGGVDDLTTLILVNAVYFRGSWTHAFDRTKTWDSSFRVDLTKTVTVPFMTRDGRFLAARMETFTMVELPYAGSDLVMDLLIPHAVDGLAGLERDLNADSFRTACESLRSSHLKLQLPRFSLRWGTASLKTHLESLGLRTPFSQANLSRMSDQPLFISDVLHQAFVSVDESGTVAAAATAAKVLRTGVSASMTVEADHPFLFLIRDNQTNAILFMGRVVDPR